MSEQLEKFRNIIKGGVRPVSMLPDELEFVVVDWQVQEIKDEIKTGLEYDAFFVERGEDNTFKQVWGMNGIFPGHDKYVTKVY